MKPGLYQHYSGKFYNVMGMARHSETLEELVIYQRLHRDYGFWVRPLQMFLENVLVDGQEKPRFRFMNALHSLPPEID